MATNVTETDTYTPEQTFSGSSEVSTTEVVVKAGSNIPALQPLAVETSTGKVVPFVGGGTDGKGVAVYISAEPIDATGGDRRMQVYNAGTFNADALVWDGTPTDAQKMSAFSGTPISVQTLQA